MTTTDSRSVPQPLYNRNVEEPRLVETERYSAGLVALVGRNCSTCSSN